MNNTKSLAKNTVALVFGTLVPKAVTVILTVYAARILGSAGLGQYAISTSFVGVFAVVSDLGLNTLFIREVAKHKDKTTVYFWSMAFIKGIMSAVYLMLVFLALRIFSYSSLVETTICLLAASIVFSAFLSLVTSLFQAHEKMEYSAIIGIANSILVTVGGIAALYMGFGVIGLGWIAILSSAIMLIVGFVLIGTQFNLGRPVVQKTFLMSIGKEAVPFAAISILITIYYRSDMLLLSKLPVPAISNEEAVGLYSASYKIIDTMQMIPGIVSAAVFPLFSRLYVQDEQVLQSSYKRILKYLVYLGIPMAVGVSLLAEPIIKLVYGAEFILSADVLRILIWAVAIIFVNSLIATLLTSIGKLNVLIVVSAVNVILNVGLNLLFIPTWGFGLSYVGAALTTLISEVVGFAIIYQYFARNLYSLGLISQIIKPLVSASVMALVVFFFKDNLLLAIGGGALVYVMVLLFIKGFDDEDQKILFTLVNKPV